jgi:hypothetical protein
MERALEPTLEESFPGSDPVNVTQPPQPQEGQRSCRMGVIRTDSSEAPFDVIPEFSQKVF